MGHLVPKAGWRTLPYTVVSPVSPSAAPAHSSSPRRADGFPRRVPRESLEHPFPVPFSSLWGYNPTMPSCWFWRLLPHQASSGSTAPAAKRMQNYCNFCHLVQTHPTDTHCCRCLLCSPVAELAALPSKTPQKSLLKAKPAKQMENAIFV